LWFQNPCDLAEGDGDAGVDGGFGEFEDFRDFAQLQAFAITEGEDGSRDFGEAEEAGADQGAFFVVGGLGVGGEVDAGEVAVFVEGGFGAAFGAAEFVVAMVECNAPKPGGEFGIGAEIFAAGEDFSEDFLGQIFGAGGITGHAGAEAMDGVLPAIDEAGERFGVVGVLNAPHVLLVAGGEEVCNDPWLVELGRPVHSLMGDTPDSPFFTRLFFGAAMVEISV
jgi:hypothetical protein